MVARRGSSPLTRGKLRRCASGEYVLRLIPAHAGKTVKVSVIAETKKAHPRSRGENMVSPSSISSLTGSSPLTRGKPVAGDRCEPGDGLIPAHAGKTMVVGSGLVSGRAHPRSRGENHGAYYGTSGVPGSSPLTRGKHCDADPRR